MDADEAMHSAEEQVDLAMSAQSLSSPTAAGMLRLAGSSTETHEERTEFKSSSEESQIDLLGSTAPAVPAVPAPVPFLTDSLQRLLSKAPSIDEVEKLAQSIKTLEGVPGELSTSTECLTHVTGAIRHMMTLYAGLPSVAVAGHAECLVKFQQGEAVMSDQVLESCKETSIRMATWLCEIAHALDFLRNQYRPAFETVQSLRIVKISEQHVDGLLNNQDCTHLLNHFGVPLRWTEILDLFNENTRSDEVNPDTRVQPPESRQPGRANNMLTTPTPNQVHMGVRYYVFESENEDACAKPLTLRHLAITVHRGLCKTLQGAYMSKQSLASGGEPAKNTVNVMPVTWPNQTSSMALEPVLEPVLEDDPFLHRLTVSCVTDAKTMSGLEFRLYQRAVTVLRNSIKNAKGHVVRDETVWFTEDCAYTGLDEKIVPPRAFAYLCSFVQRLVMCAHDKVTVSRLVQNPYIQQFLKDARQSVAVAHTGQPDQTAFYQRRFCLDVTIPADVRKPTGRWFVSLLYQQQRVDFDKDHTFLPFPPVEDPVYLQRAMDQSVQSRPEVALSHSDWEKITGLYLELRELQFTILRLLHEVAAHGKLALSFHVEITPHHNKAPVVDIVVRGRSAKLLSELSIVSGIDDGTERATVKPIDVVSDPPADTSPNHYTRYTDIRSPGGVSQLSGAVPSCDTLSRASSVHTFTHDQVSLVESVLRCWSELLQPLSSSCSCRHAPEHSTRHDIENCPESIKNRKDVDHGCLTELSYRLPCPQRDPTLERFGKLPSELTLFWTQLRWLFEQLPGGEFYSFEGWHWSDLLKWVPNRQALVHLRMAAKYFNDAYTAWNAVMTEHVHKQRHISEAHDQPSVSSVMDEEPFLRWPISFGHHKVHQLLPMLRRVTQLSTQILHGAKAKDLTFHDADRCDRVLPVHNSWSDVLDPGAADKQLTLRLLTTSGEDTKKFTVRSKSISLGLSQQGDDEQLSQYSLRAMRAATTHVATNENSFRVKFAWTPAFDATVSTLRVDIFAAAFVMGLRDPVLRDAGIRFLAWRAQKTPARAKGMKSVDMRLLLDVQAEMQFLHDLVINDPFFFHLPSPVAQMHLDVHNASIAQDFERRTVVMDFSDFVFEEAVDIVEPHVQCSPDMLVVQFHVRGMTNRNTPDQLMLHIPIKTIRSDHHYSFLIPLITNLLNSKDTTRKKNWQDKVRGIRTVLSPVTTSESFVGVPMRTPSVASASATIDCTPSVGSLHAPPSRVPSDAVVRTFSATGTSNAESLNSTMSSSMGGLTDTTTAPSSSTPGGATMMEIDGEDDAGDASHVSVVPATPEMSGATALVVMATDSVAATSSGAVTNMIEDTAPLSDATRTNASNGEVSQERPSDVPVKTKNPVPPSYTPMMI